VYFWLISAHAAPGADFAAPDALVRPDASRLPAQKKGRLSMPWAPAHPGVYVEEVRQPADTIEAAPTAVTAFVGRAALGPLNQPVALGDFAAFELLFGGLHVDCTMAYAVRDFFRNGGTRAVVLRLAHADARAATVTLPCNGHRVESLVLQARSAGAWGLGLSAAIEHEPGRAVPGPGPAPSRRGPRFDLHLRWQRAAGDAVEEVFHAVSTAPGDERYLPDVLARESTLVQVRGRMPAQRPASTVRRLDGRREVAWLRADAGSGSDGGALEEADLLGDPAAGTGLHALARAGTAFNLLCIPPPVRDANTLPSDYAPVPLPVLEAALALCVQRRAILLVDPDPRWSASAGRSVVRTIDSCAALRSGGAQMRNAALYFPCLRQVDPLREDRVDTFVPSGAVAGVIARTDARVGVWKAPAGMEAVLAGVQDLQIELGDSESDRLGEVGVNCLRILGAGDRVIWGARTLRGADELADDYKYLPVRRLALFLEQSIEQGTRWATLEPGGEALWARLRQAVGAFMQELFRQGAFQGGSAAEAWFVRCDATTMTQADIDAGRLVILVGFAPVKPAEFVIIRIGLHGRRPDA